MPTKEKSKKCRHLKGSLRSISQFKNLNNLKCSTCTSTTCQRLCLKCFNSYCHTCYTAHYQESKLHMISVDLNSLEFHCEGCHSIISGSKDRNQILQDWNALLEQKDTPCMKNTINSEESIIETTEKLMPAGLYNLGNTCFFNAVLQECLCYSKAFVQDLDNYSKAFVQDLDNDSKDFPIIEALSQLIYTLRKGGRATSPQVLFKKLASKYPVYRNMGQQDSHELLMRLLNLLNEENPSLTLPFEGKLTCTMTCSKCHHRHDKTEAFLDLSLPIPIKAKHSTVTLEDCLSLFMEKETMTTEMNWKCDQCHSKDSVHNLANDLNGLSIEKTMLGHVQYSIQTAPKALILHLKRFSVGRSIQKMNQFVQFPKILTLNDILYELDGIVIHSGSPNGGHYTASVEYNNHWYHLSDSHVRLTELQDILKNQAYILLYSQKLHAL